MGTIATGFGLLGSTQRRGRRLRAQAATEREAQRTREEEALGLVRGQLTQGVTQQLRAAGLEGLERQFGQAATRLESGLRRRGLQGQVGQQLGRLETARGQASSELLRNLALQEAQRRSQVVSQLAGLGFQLPPSLGFLGQQQALEQNRMQAILGFLNQAVSTAASTGTSLAGSGATVASAGQRAAGQQAQQANVLQALQALQQQQQVQGVQVLPESIPTSTGGQARLF
jgi:hypothetical protein